MPQAWAHTACLPVIHLQALSSMGELHFFVLVELIHG